MSKLRAVIRHEYMTIVKQPSFWIVMVAIPLLIGVIIGLVTLGNQASSDRIGNLARELESVSIVDDSGFVVPEIVEARGLELGESGSLETAKQAVIDGESTGLIYYPADIAETQQYEIYVEGTDFARVSSVQAVGEAVLQSSIYAPLGSPEVIALAQNGASSTLVTYEDGQQTAGFNQYIVPGLFAVIFYLILFFSVGYILTSISEEKENRSMEMALAYLQPRTLIVGKLVGVILVTITQLVFFVAVAVLAYFIALSAGVSAIQLPAGIDLADIVFDPTAIFFGLAFLVVGFMLYAGFMAITAAALPARQANSWSAVFFLAGFSPFYFLTLILTDPQNPVVQFVTYFPLTSPSVALIRNTIGNMSLLESIAALVVMTVSMLVAVWLAVKIFPKGALEFQNPLSFKSLFTK